MAVEAVKQEVGWIEASNLVMGYSTKDNEVHNAKKKLWTIKEEYKNTKGVWVHSGWDGNKNRMQLQCPSGMA